VQAIIFMHWHMDYKIFNIMPYL